MSVSSSTGHPSSLINDCPDYVINAAKGIAPNSQAPIYSDKAREIMSKMGYAAGKGLGKLSKGILELRDWNRTTPPPLGAVSDTYPRKIRVSPSPRWYAPTTPRSQPAESPRVPASPSHILKRTRLSRPNFNC